MRTNAKNSRVAKKYGIYRITPAFASVDALNKIPTLALAKNTPSIHKTVIIVAVIYADLRVFFTKARFFLRNNS